MTAIAPFGGGIAGSIANSVLGSVVSQGVGVATGIQDKFSFKGVALAAVAGGVGGGIGEVLPMTIAGSALLDGVTRGAIGSVVTQGIGVATGLQSKFDFAGVAAAAIGAGVAQQVGLRVPGGATDGKAAGLVNRIAANTAGGIAGAATRSVLTGTGFGDNLLAALPDVIGQTVGGYAARQLARSRGAGTGTAAGEAIASDVAQDEQFMRQTFADDLAIFAGDTATNALAAVGIIPPLGGAGNARMATPAELLSYQPDPSDSAYATFDGTDIVVTARQRPQIGGYDFGAVAGRSDYRPIDAGQSISSATPRNRWSDYRTAVLGRQSDAYAQWSAGGLGYVAAPIGFVLSSVSGAVDLAGSYYHDRDGRIAPVDRQTTDIALTLGGSAGLANRLGRVGNLAAKGPLISDVRAISAADVNAPFLAKGWDAPYSYGSQARTFTTSADLDFVRVTTTNPEGAFLVRAKEISGMTPEQIQVQLALPKVPTNMLDVRVPIGTRMQTGFVGPQPAFGVTTRGGIQYQILDQIPSQSFGPMRPIR